MDGPTYHVLSMYVNCKGDYRPSPACNNENAVGVVRCILQMVVSDASDTAVFVAFDTTMTQVMNVHVRAAEVSQLLTLYGRRTWQSPQKIVSCTLTFQLKLTPFNFYTKHQRCTISSIYDHHQRNPLMIFLLREVTTILIMIFQVLVQR